MSQRHSSQHSEQSGRGEHRPTLPPIRDLFRGKSQNFLRRTNMTPRIALTMECFSNFTEELSRSVHASQVPRYPSGSPHMSASRLAPNEEAYASGGPRPVRSFPSYPEDTRSASQSGHARNASDSRYNAPVHGSPAQYASYGHHPSAHGNGYPYAASQPQPSRHPSIPIPGSSSGHAQDAASHSTANPAAQPHRYECSYCGKGFTRPSSLKVGLLLCPGPPFNANNAIWLDPHQYAHWGET